MMRLPLSDQERQVVAQLVRTTAERQLRAHLQLVLMASRGRRHKRIAHDLGIAPRRVQRWLQA